MLESPAPVPVPPVKFNPRKVSAIRDFPAGCGPTGLPPALDAPVEDGTASLKLVKSPAKGIDEGVVKVVEGGRSLEVEKGEEVVVKSPVKGIDKVVVEKLDPLKTYSPPRRRKASVIRDFPAGCGPIALPVNGVVSGDGIVDLKSMAFFVEKNSVEKEMPMVEGLDKAELNGRVEGEVERRDANGSQWGDVLEIGVAAASAASIRETLDAEQKVVDEHRAMSGGLKQMESAKNAEDEAGSSSKQAQLRDEETSKMETSDGVKKLMVKGIAMEVEGLDKVASVVKFGDQVRNETKEIQGRAPENSVEPRDRPRAQNSGSNESVVKEEEKRKLTVSSVSKKKIAVHEMRQVIKSPNSIEAQESKLCCPDATSPSGNKVVNGDAWSLVVRSPKSRDPKESKSSHSDATATSGSKVADRYGWSLVVRSPKSRESQESKPPSSNATSPSVSTRETYKGSFEIQRNRKNLGKRSYEELEDEALGINAQADSALVASGGDRLIVQALMSAQNCPWRKGSRKSPTTGARSVTSINKMKKEGKQPHKTFMGVSRSQDESIVAIRDDEEPAFWEAEIPKPLVAYKKPHEIDVNFTPLGPSVSNLGSGDCDGVPRNRVKRALRLFQVISRKLLQEEEAGKQVVSRTRRIDLAAANILKDRNEWVYRGQAFVGVVPGVEVGDEFHYRVELSIVGLHRPFQGGIDSTKVNGMPVATSIVASGGYPDDMDNSDVLIYSGSGGNPQGGDKRDKQPGDQKLERGNLALKNSIEAKTPVRVIYGFKENKAHQSHDSKTKVVTTFTYDGLYLVEDYWQERGPHGFYVFKFRLRRIPGQPDIGLKQVKKSNHLKVREGLCIKDISEGKEIIPICAINTIDDDRPAPFIYMTKIIYPSWFVPTPPAGCNCANGCSDSNECACAVKNGGEIPFNFNGNIIQAKPLVYECGPSCKCPPTCYNRVSQHGVKVQLEIFKTTTRGWGVRSSYSIPSGSFICEYTGELLRDIEAEQKHNDEYLFDIGHNYDDQSLWEGLPPLVPPLHSTPLDEMKEDVGFTIDAAEYGNVGRFINHSCSPNLYAQNVLYDHDDRRIPHIMLFAADNIPPLQELTYHYNYTIDEVRDSEGNIKRKDCYCGASDCTGRLY